MTGKRTRRSYSLQDKEAALTALVFAGGNVQKASDDLAAQGYEVARRTLNTWRDEHADRYLELQDRYRPQVEKLVAAQAEAFMLRAGEVEHKILERLNDEMDALPPKELAGTLRNLSTSKALQADKIQGPLRGRPQLVEHRHSPDELLSKLTRVLGPGSIDSTATELSTQALQPETAA